MWMLVRPRLWLLQLALIVQIFSLLSSAGVLGVTQRIDVRDLNMCEGPKPNPIRTGYVAFGDSFAAGIGTGITDGSSCRKGEFSYPKQLAATTADIDFQDHTCSGAIIQDLGTQIDSWQNPTNSDIATITIGGNDLQFTSILNACILWIAGPRFSGDCKSVVDTAFNIVNGDKLRDDLFQNLQRIIDKSGRVDFKIFLTGYPAFFNVDTTYCNEVTFQYWWPHYRFLIEEVEPWLTIELRSRLNDLVQSLNSRLSTLASEFNSRHPDKAPITFVSTDAAFNGHRFCEQGVSEPESTRADTWFFLSGWGDNKIASTSKISVEDAISFGNTTELPNPETCDSHAKDIQEYMECMVAKAVSESNSFAQTVFQNDTYMMEQGEFGAVQVPWWLPTRQVKTFHPRTLGHLAIRNAIMDMW